MELRQRFAGRIHDRDGQAPGFGAGCACSEEPKNSLRVPSCWKSPTRSSSTCTGSAREPFQHDAGLAREGLGHLSAIARLARTVVAAAAARLRALAGTAARGDRASSGGSQTRPSSRTSPTCRGNVDQPPLRGPGRHPRAEIEKLLGFMDLAMDARLEGYLSKPLPLSKHTQTSPNRASGGRTRRRSSG